MSYIRATTRKAVLAGGLLKNDKRAIFTAASHAQKAADYLHALQPQTDAATGEKMREAA